jgi:uncharacterized delta-60 repeat protein
MTFVFRFIRAAAAGLLVALTACGGGGEGDGETGTPPATTLIGTSGGTVTGPNGAKVVIPPGALASDTPIAVEQSSAGAPALPAGFIALGSMFAYTPHGTLFAAPVTVTLPFDPALVPAGGVPALYKTNVQNAWEQVVGASFGANSVSAAVTGFSFAQVVIPPLRSSDPLRIWSFSELRGDALQEIELDADVQIVGAVREVREFGPALFDSAYLFDDGLLLAPDAKATGHIASSVDGVTFWVGAEAPAGNANLPQSPVGSISRLQQLQTFIKQAPDATLRFTLTTVFIEARDFNAVLNRVCPPVHQQGLLCDLIEGELYFDVQAITADPLPTTTRPITFFHTAGYAALTGFAGNWNSAAFSTRVSRTPLWTVEDFDFVIESVNDAPEAHVLMKFRRPRTYTVDLSSIAVGKAFTLKINTTASAYNRIAGPPSEFATSVGAFLRDPLTIGGASLATTGLLRTDTQNPVLGVELPETPAACLPGPVPDPAAGMLQFSAASYRMAESSHMPTVTVTRTGGSRGAVTATVTTSDGTALAGTDYQAVNGTVFFADGDSAPRVVEVPIVQDVLSGEPDKTVNLRLSQPGGCAALGPQIVALLTIVDDDPAPPLPSGLDSSFGTAGKATLDRFGGDRSGMALQADGKIVMVGGTFTDFILARFNADGSIDRSFGIDGKVTTDMGSGLRREEALAVAVQSDSKIVVVGYTAIDATPPAPDLPSTFAIARYNSDGSLDTGFGTGGKASGSVNGIARAVAIQPDGKIVLAGDFELELSNGVFVSDFVIARFNANGSLDLPFGTSGTGQVATDIGGAANSGRNLVLQPNGAIVVSGTPQCSQPGCLHTDVVRYNANGTLDASFGSGGKLTLAELDVGQGLVRQVDGKLALVGTLVQPIAPATARFVLMRLNADGSLDTGFGTAGTASTALSEHAVASGIALQTDGKLVVIGTRAFSANPNFIVARYNVNGSLDTGFANAGTLSIDFFGFDDIGENVLVQPDGRIVVGGQARNLVDGYGLARINP